GSARRRRGLGGPRPRRAPAPRHGAAGDQARLYRPRPELLPAAHVPSLPHYQRLYQRSVEEPHEFWGDIAKEFYWKRQHTGPFLKYNFDVTKGKIFIEWMKGATTNICYNLLDRNVNDKKLGDKVAFYWEGNEPGDYTKITYSELLQKVCQFANVLRSQGVKKGDRVSIYLPMILELVIAMLACARIGALHSVVFAGFSADSLCERILDCGCSLLITAAPAFYRGCSLKKCIVVKHLGREEIAVDGTCSKSPPLKRLCQDVQVPPKGKRSLLAPWNPAMDMWWHELMGGASKECEPEWCDAEDELFILYTSGSTGKPKGVLHTVGGYMIFAATSFKYVFDYQPEDVYWCTADIGWITGHSYLTYGPLANGATSVLFEGVPTYPDVGRMWSIIDKYKVTKFYTAPTAIRLLMKYGEEPVKKYSRKSLKVLGTVGEPINPEAWLWYYRVVGEERCPIVDTFWQTETVSPRWCPFPWLSLVLPTFPFFGVVPAILSESGEELEGEAEGYLVFKQPWPGIMRTLYGKHQQFETVYFKKFPGYYVTGDGCRRDKDGYYWITGRIDDMLNVSGHLLSTAEVESALLEHEAVAEAAVVSHPHPLKGECLYCFVTLREGHEFTKNLTDELKKQVREKIGPIATPDYIQYAPSLPKTRSGKITRRILRKIAKNDQDLGDISTLADPGIIKQLFNSRCDTKQ
uniref:Acetyl-coenzyme A synthetase n=1 Tax=Malurus cyaneus samueli TaxID=2593467 RepID=A0A8C5TR07_9PASS